MKVPGVAQARQVLGVDRLARERAALEAQAAIRVVDRALVEGVPRGEDHRLVHQRQHDRVAKALGWVVHVCVDHIG